MDDVLKAALEDSASLSVTDTSVNAIAQLAIKQLSLQSAVEQKQAELKQLEAELKQVSEIDLPNAMLENGMRSFKLADGSSISVEKFYGASIKVEDRPDAFKWLEDNGHGALIKTDVRVKFGKGLQERTEARQFVAELEEDGFTADLDESVHHSTLKAWAKEQIEMGTELPPIFTVFVGEKAKIILPKK